MGLGFSARHARRSHYFLLSLQGRLIAAAASRISGLRVRGAGFRALGFRMKDSYHFEKLLVFSVYFSFD